MIIKETRVLINSERERIKAIMNKETQFGFVMTNLLHDNPTYKGTLIIPHVFEERKPLIRIKNYKTLDTYEKELPLEIIGNWEIECGNDIIMLEIK